LFVSCSRNLCQVNDVSFEIYAAHVHVDAKEARELVNAAAILIGLSMIDNTIAILWQAADWLGLSITNVVPSLADVWVARRDPAHHRIYLPLITRSAGCV